MKNYFPCELKMDFLFGRVCTEGKKWANWSLHRAENSIQFEFSLTAFAWSNHHSWRTGREKLVLSYNVSVSVFSYCFLCFFVLWRNRCECQRERKKPSSLTLMSAPDRSSLARMRSSRVTSSATVIRLVWIWKILLLVFSSGRGNSILRSILPEEYDRKQKHHKLTVTLFCHESVSLQQINESHSKTVLLIKLRWSIIH